LRFVVGDSLLVNECDLTYGQKQSGFPAPGGTAPDITETGSAYLIQGGNFSVTLSKSTGLISDARVGNAIVITGGPFINLLPAQSGTWQLGTMSVSKGSTWTTADITGLLGTMPCAFKIKIDGNGLMRTSYTLNGALSNASEAGVTFEVPGSVEKLAWDRRGLWDYYPDDHIGRNGGVALRENAAAQNQQFRVKPAWAFNLDTRDYFEYSSSDAGDRGTNDFRSMKENIIDAVLLFANSAFGLRVESDGSDAVRMEKGAASALGWLDDRDPLLQYSGAWQQYADAGDWSGTETYGNTANASVEYAFTGTSIAWIGPKNQNLGLADVYVDNVLEQHNVDCYSGSGKIFQQVLFAKNGLSAAAHTIKVTVTGNKNASATGAYVIVDAFSANGTAALAAWKVHIDGKWNYPNLSWGNYNNTVNIPSGYNDSVSVRLIATDSLPVSVLRQKPSSSAKLPDAFCFHLGQTSTLQFYLHQKTNVRIELYNLGGRLLLSRHLGEQQSGLHVFRFSTDDRIRAATNMYLYKVAEER
jgi:hypothetical protein